MKMIKVFVFAVFLSVGTMLVFSERYHHYPDCTNTPCSGNDTHAECHHDTCTCISHLTCDQVADCVHACSTCHTCDNHYHCVDHICLCFKDDIIDKR